MNIDSNWEYRTNRKWSGSAEVRIKMWIFPGSYLPYFFYCDCCSPGFFPGSVALFCSVVFLTLVSLRSVCLTPTSWMDDSVPCGSALGLCPSITSTHTHTPQWGLHLFPWDSVRCRISRKENISWLLRFVSKFGLEIYMAKTRGTQELHDPSE